MMSLETTSKPKSTVYAIPHDIVARNSSDPTASTSFIRRLPPLPSSIEPPRNHHVSMGMITLTIKRGELHSCRTTTMFDRMDPYVVVRPSWSHQSYKTLPCYNAHKNPTWSKVKHQSIIKIRFPGVNDWKTKMHIELSMYDKNRFTKDVLLGCATLAIVPLIRSHTNNSSQTLTFTAGRLYIDYRYQSADNGGDEVSMDGRSSRSDLGALLGVVAEAKHAGFNDSNIANECCCPVVLPSSSFRRRWDVCTMVCLLYVAVFTPVQISFLSNVQTVRNIEEWLFVFVLDRCIDFIFLVDIAINFRSAWETEEGVETYHYKEAAWQYCTTWFLLDLISAMPLDFLDLLLDGEDASQLRALKLLRLFRLIKIAKVIRASRIVKRFEAEMTIKYALLRLLKFGGVIMIVSHWNACGFYLISQMSDGVAANTWAASAGIAWGEAATPVEQYTSALYWAMMTLTTIGYGDIVATNLYERIYVILTMMISALIFAYVVGTMCHLVEGLNSQTLYFQSMIDDINDYMEMTHLPSQLRRRIRKYCLFRRDGAQHQNEQEIWNFLSPSLRLEAALHQYLPILEQVPYFSKTSSHFVSELACHLTQIVYGPNEVLIAQGTRERIMFILNKGRVQVEKKTKSRGIRVTSLADGSYFGEQALLFGTYRQETVRSLSFCNVCALKKEDVDSVLEKYPRDKTILKKALIRLKWQKVFAKPEFLNALKTHPGHAIFTTRKRGLLKKTNGKNSSGNDAATSGRSAMAMHTIDTTPSVISLDRLGQRLNEMNQTQKELIESISLLTSKVSHLVYAHESATHFGTGTRERSNSDPYVSSRPSSPASGSRRSSKHDNAASQTSITKAIDLDEFLGEGMASVMPSPMKTLKLKF